MIYSGFSLFFLLYAAMCFYIGFKRPPKLIRLVKAKLGNKVGDDGAAIASYIAGAVAVIVAIVLLVIKP